jgi:hypothetical protein
MLGVIVGVGEGVIFGEDVKALDVGVGEVGLIMGVDEWVVFGEEPIFGFVEKVASIV